MAEKSGNEGPPDALTLVRDVVREGGKLLGQQIELLRSEMLQELGRARTAAVEAAAGAGLVAAGGVLGTFMAVHGLHRATGLPLWGCYGLVGGLLGAAGVGLLRAAGSELAGLDLVPRQTVAALRENVTWLEKQVTPAPA